MDPFFTAEQVDKYTVVTFQTASLMNPNELEKIGAALYRLIDEEQRRFLLIDFTRVKYLSSQAIGIVLTLNKKLSQQPGSSFVLCGVGPSLMQLLKITRLDRILTIKENQAEGLQVQPAE